MSESMCVFVGMCINLLYKLASYKYTHTHTLHSWGSTGHSYSCVLQPGTGPPPAWVTPLAQGGVQQVGADSGNQDAVRVGVGGWMCMCLLMCGWVCGWVGGCVLADV